MRQCCADVLNTPSVSSLPSLYAWYMSSQHQQQARSAPKRRRGANEKLQRAHASLRDQVDAGSNSSTELLAGRSERRTRASHNRPCKDSSAQPHSNLDCSLEQAVSAGNRVRAHQLFHELHDLEPQCLPEAQLCDRLLQLLSQQSDFNKAWEVYNTVKTVPLRYSTLAAIMNAAIRAGDPNKAQRVFRSMQQRGYKPNITTWCHLISSLSRSRNGSRKGWPFRETAYSLWKELLSRKDALQDLDASAFATGMMACCGVGNVEEARSLLGGMRAAGYPPDIRIFNILLRGYAQSRGVDVISGLLESIRAEGLKPSATTYNTLIDAYVTYGMLREAREALQEAKDSSARIDAWAYSSLLKGYVRAGMLQEATDLVQDMEASQILPNVVTLTTLLDGCVRAGKMEDAEEVMSKMRRRRIPANVVTYNTLLKGYAQTGNLQAVRDVLHRMGEDGIHPREDTFNTLMDGALQNNDPQLVPQLFRQLVNLQLNPGSLSYTALITALARLSQPEAALRAYGQLEEAGGICGISLNALVAALANANRIPEAEEHLKRATELAARQGRSPPIEAYGAVLKAYARLKDGEAAMDLFQEFQRLGGEPDDRLVDVAVTACIRAQQYKRALQLPALQFVRAMERRGKNIDKARLKQALEVVIRSQSNALRRRSGLSPARNENLERLKFWIGFPNRYYGSDSEE